MTEDIITSGDAVQAIDVQQAGEVLRGDGVATGVEPSKGTNALETDVTSGVAIVAGNVVNVAAQTVTHDSGGTEPRKDIVYVASDGTLNIAKGVEAAADGPADATLSTDPFAYWSPSPLSLDLVNGVPVAEVFIDAGATDYDGTDHFRTRRLTTDVALNSVQARAEALLPSYDETANAPAVERSIIWVTGAGSDAQGIYRHNGTAYQPAGSGLSLADIAIGADKDWAGYGVTGMRDLELTDEYRVHDGRGSINLPGMHTNYADGLSAAEVGRWEAASGEQFEVWRLDVNFKGGGHNSNFSVEIRDESDGSSLASTSSLINGGQSPLGTSAAGADITLRVTNSTGAAQDVAIDAKVFLVTA